MCHLTFARTCGRIFSIRRGVIAVVIASLLVALGYASEARSGEEVPYSTRRISPMNSSYYAVVKAARGESLRKSSLGQVTVTIVQHPKDEPQAKPGIAHDARVNVPYNHDVRICPGDVVLGRVELKMPPRLLLVSTSGLGVIAMGIRPPDAHLWSLHELRMYLAANYIIAASADGKNVRRWESVAVLDAVRREEKRINGKLDSSAVWIDEPNKRLLYAFRLTAKDDKEVAWVVISVSLDTGAVERASVKDVVGSVVLENSASLPLIIRTAMEMGLVGEPGMLKQLLHDTRLSQGERVAVAAFMARSGASDGPAMVEATAVATVRKLQSDPSFDERVSAAIRLGDELGFDEETDKLRAAVLAVEFLPECDREEALATLKYIANHTAHRGALGRAAAVGLRKRCSVRSCTKTLSDGTVGRD